MYVYLSLALSLSLSLYAYIYIYIYIYVLFIHIYIYIYIYRPAGKACSPRGERAGAPPLAPGAGASGDWELHASGSWGFIGAPYLGAPLITSLYVLT